MNLRNIFKNYGWFTVVWFIILFLIVVLSNSPRGKELTSHFFDPSRTTATREEAVVVGIDDKSLQTIGAWPWDRTNFALLTSELSKSEVKAIVYDVLFLEPRTGDDAFKKAIKESKVPIILASKNDSGSYLESFLHTTSSPTLSALANVGPDSDGKVRMFPKVQALEGSCVDTLSHTVFTLYTHKTPSCDDLSTYSFRHSTKIRTISAVDIITATNTDATLKDKVIFIGSVSLDLPDHFVGMNGSKIAGVYVHASIFNSLLNNDIDTEIPNYLAFLYLLFFAIVTTALVYKLRSLVAQVSILIAILVVVVVLAQVTFDQHFIIPAPFGILTVLLYAGYTILYRFLKERKQNDYIKNLFSKYVDKDVLKELLATGAELRLGGEKREATVLFSDIRGFTTLSESMTPEELTSTLNAYLSAMSPVILKEKGTIDKYIGDAIMAFWNAPLFTPNHQLHAVRAALIMHDELEEFNKKNTTTLAMGVGIHTGEVVVGNVGSMERVNYTVLGDVVNNSSRLEGLTKRYGVGLIVTEEVKNKISTDDIVFRKLDIITVKGKHLPTVIYEAMWSKNADTIMLENYAIAFDEYERGDFMNAKRHFKFIADEGDKPSGKMFERLEKLGDITPEGWDGIWRFDEK